MIFNKYKERGAYHWTEYANQTTYGKYANTIKDWVTEKAILDIGAGDGLITSLIGAVGVDDNEIAVDLAVEKHVPVKQGSAYDLPYDSEMFEAVFMGDTIEHLEFPEDALDEAKRVLRKGGFLYITTPPAREDRVLQDPYHYREYTPEELTDLVQARGFTLVEPITNQYARMYGKFKRS